MCFLLNLIYCIFLVNEVDNAIEELKMCRERSVGKNTWNAKDELHNEDLDNLFVESCRLLYQALLILAKVTLEDNTAKAIRYCQVAQNRAKDGKYHL